MTFLQPALLLLLPLAALPVVIHLIHLFRRKPVHWAAMMFLRMAQQMNKGLSRLRQILILACRVLAVATLLFMVCRPLAGGWLGLTGGVPDTVLVLLDRSASMEQRPATATYGKRETGLRNVVKAIRDAVGTRSRVVLLDSATSQPMALDKPESLLALPQSTDSDTAADIPGLLQNALDYIASNKTGRTDVWLVSDLQKHDWDASSPRWESLRKAFSALPGVRFHLLNYPQPPADDFSIRVDAVQLRQTASDSKLLLDITLDRNTENPAPIEVPVRCVLHGVGSTLKIEMKDAHLSVRGMEIPVDRSLTRGWGRLELPADSNAANNVFHFVFDHPPVLKSAVVSENPEEAAALLAALSAPADPARQYAADLFTPSRVHEISWDETGLIVWHAPVPREVDPLRGLLQEHVQRGRALLFLPPENPDETQAWGVRWGAWETFAEVRNPEGWRNDADLLANTQDGVALAVGGLEIRRRCGIQGAGHTLAHLHERTPLLMRAPEQSRVYFLGTLPGPNHSSLSREGVVLFALMHRALQSGAQSLGFSQMAGCGARTLPMQSEPWRAIHDPAETASSTLNMGLRAGVVESGKYRIALNRPTAEDTWEYLNASALQGLFAGLDFRVLTDSVEDGRDLTSEIWRTFLMAMALCLIGEALLCLPSTSPSSPPANALGRATRRPVS
jgi:hypothetical protein